MKTSAHTTAPVAAATRYLPLESADQRRLRALGLAKIRQYAALPGAGILPRFGYAGLRAWRLAHGRDDARVRAWLAKPDSPLPERRAYLQAWQGASAAR